MLKKFRNASETALFLKCINFVFRAMMMFSAFGVPSIRCLVVSEHFHMLVFWHKLMIWMIRSTIHYLLNHLEESPPHPKSRNTAPKRTTPLKPKALLILLQLLVKGKRDNFLTKLTISNQRQQTIHQKMPMYGQTS